MHTLVDFITHVKGVEYIISVLTITGFMLYWEALKPSPFKSLARAASEDISRMRGNRRGTMTTVRRLCAAPFIGLFYVVTLPFVFFAALSTEAAGLAASGARKVLGLAGRTAGFGWRPTEAYLAGRKDKKQKAGAAEAEPASPEKDGAE